ncbi:hypothetical protein [Variovorax sp. PAMC 28711]|uniref:hypothetical protein n=1 Tax=Variovorax sp. PAMC 28711 TaxID=1795631 RepID=UPI001F3718D2|nr:hypothetical protein [Variovorax sp. PAMC 28711]
MTVSRYSFVLAFLAATGAAHAQGLPPGVRLGMTADALQSALPVERVVRPQRLAGGLVGSWRTAPIAMAGLPFEPTFFFAGGELKRVAYLTVTDDPAQVPQLAAAFAELVQWGRAQFGHELGSSDPGSAYAAWSQGDADIYAQHTVDGRRATVRLVYKASQRKDGSAL